MFIESEKIISGLNDRQLEAVESLEGETLVIAGAGSGKTAVLTRRCAFLIAQGVRPGSILSLTFTNKAANEMNHRMRKLLEEVGIHLPYTPVWANDYSVAPLFCTFHSLGLRLLREFGDRLGLCKQFNILDSDDQQKMVRDIIKELNIDAKTLLPSLVMHFIGKCKQELLTPQESHKLDKNYLPIFHTIYRHYWQKCEENQVVDFDDLIFKTYLLLTRNSDVLEICQQRWEHIQIDEFQDINNAQFELMYLLYGKKTVES